MRRRTLLGAAIVGGAAPLWSLLPSAASATDWVSTGQGLATGIATEMVKSEFGEIGGVAFGSLLGVLGIGDDTSAKLDEINSKLDEINGKLDHVIAQLSALQQSVDSLRNELRQTLARASYDQLYSQVQPIIVRNGVLLGLYKDILDPAQRDAAALNLELFRTQVGDGLLLNAVRQGWHNALYGGNGQTGLIEAFCRKVWAAPGAYTAQDARLVEDQWDFFDGQQALSLMFLVDFYRANRAASGIQPMLVQWAANRRAQLTRLRGVQRRYDLFPIIGKPAPGEDPLLQQQEIANRLPPNVVMSKNPPLFWYANIFPTRRITSWVDITNWTNEVGPEVVRRTGRLLGWYIPTEAQLAELLREVSPDNPDRLAFNGFQLPTGSVNQVLVAKWIGDDTLEAYQDAVGPVSPPPEDEAALLLVHEALGPKERFWYG